LVIRPSSTQLTEARDRFDAEQAERRHREDEVLATYAAVAGETDEVLVRRDHALTELDRQRSAVGCRSSYCC
jgi:hypothetical protein